MSPLPFQHLVLLEPLGLPYGSSGRLLSPEALTGRSTEHFPPYSPALSGLLASQLDRGSRWDLHTAEVVQPLIKTTSSLLRGLEGGTKGGRLRRRA
ncbi:MAG: hypothetical protein ACKOCM_09760, partial [Cyanobacteriota bacterium]